jgi:GntR family transcriptional regulator
MTACGDGHRPPAATRTHRQHESIAVETSSDRITAVPLYVQIAEVVAAGIRRGRLRPGQPIPAATALARTHNVSVPTATRSVRWLHARGYVTPGPRNHTWLATPPVETFHCRHHL